MLTGDLTPRARMTLLAKDTRLAQEAAQAVGCDGLLGALAARLFAAALDAGLAELDDAALLQFLEHQPRRAWAGRHQCFARSDPGRREAGAEA